MKIYFATALSHNPDVQKLHQNLITELHHYGQILDPWKISQSLMKSSIKSPDQQIHDQSIRQLEMADVLVVEGTVPSLGVGYELGIAEQLDIPTLFLYNPRYRHTSAIIKGSRKFKIVTYHSLKEAHQLIDSFLSEFQ